MRYNDMFRTVDIENPFDPLLEDWPGGDIERYGILSGKGIDIDKVRRRDEFVGRYSWAIPSRHAIEVIAKCAPRIVELGAGTGWWASLLAQRGVDVVAYDPVPGGIWRDERGGPKALWYDVQEGDATKATDHPDRTLMLCWPSYNDPWAAGALLGYALAGGTQVVYIGEWRAATADELFHDLLEDWEEIEDITIPKWEGLWDRLYIYEKKS